MPGFKRQPIGGNVDVYGEPHRNPLPANSTSRLDGLTDRQTDSHARSRLQRGLVSELNSKRRTCCVEDGPCYVTKWSVLKRSLPLLQEEGVCVGV